MCREVDDLLREVNEWYDGIERRRLGVTLREEPGRYEKQEEDTTPTMTTGIMTPGTPVEHRRPGNSMAALQLPPAQLQSTPVFQFSASRQMTKPRSARHRFKTHAIAGPSKETVRTTVTDTDTQTMTVNTRTMGTHHYVCGCLQCTDRVSIKCKWKHIIKTAQLIDHAVVKQQQNFAITLLLIAATEWHVGGTVYNIYEEKRLKRRDRRVRKNSKGHQTPKVWKGTVRNASSQVGTETANMETQTAGKEKPKKQSHTAVQTCDTKGKGFSKTSALLDKILPPTVPLQQFETGARLDYMTLSRGDINATRTLNQITKADNEENKRATRQKQYRNRTDTDRIKEEEGGRNWAYR